MRWGVLFSIAALKTGSWSESWASGHDRLREIAHTRSGDNGDIVNIGVIAKEPEYYPSIEEHVATAWVNDHFGELSEGKSNDTR